MQKKEKYISDGALELDGPPEYQSHHCSGDKDLRKQLGGPSTDPLPAFLRCMDFDPDTIKPVSIKTPKRVQKISRDSANFEGNTLLVGNCMKIHE